VEVFFAPGDRGRYVQYLAVVSHVLIIGAVGGLLLVPLRLFQQDPSLSLSPGAFALAFAFLFGIFGG
jgi:hypothetical protein